MRPQTMVENLLLLAAVLMTPCNALRAAEPSVSDLIAQLGDEDYETREAAERQLTELGDATRGALRDLKTDDPEVAMRAARVLYRTATCENVVTLDEADALRLRHIEELLRAVLAGDQEAVAATQGRIEAAWKRIEELAPAADRDLKLADLHLAHGLVLFGLCRGSRSDERVIQMTYAEMRDAVDLYEKALEQHPGREDIEKRQQAAAMRMYGVSKSSRIYFGRDVKQR